MWLFVVRQLLVDTHIVYLGVVVAFVRKKPVALAVHSNNSVLDLDSPPAPHLLRRRSSQRSIPTNKQQPQTEEGQVSDPRHENGPVRIRCLMPALHSVTDLLADDDASPGAPSSAVRANHAEPVVL